MPKAKKETVKKSTVKKETIKDSKILEVKNGGRVTKDVSETIDMLIDNSKAVLKKADVKHEDDFVSVIKAVIQLASKGLDVVLSVEEKALENLKIHAPHLEDMDFLKRLKNLNMTPEHLEHVQDSDSHLSDANIWRTIRDRRNEN